MARWSRLPDLEARCQQRLSSLRECLARRLNVASERVHFVPTVRLGVALLACALPLGPGDEVLATSHEYPLLAALWRELAARRGFRYREFELPLTHAELLEQLPLGSQTRVLYFSHVTALTSLQLPLAELCRWARAAGVTTIVDGAHGFGQVEIDLGATRPDVYVGSLQKWVGAPSGAFVVTDGPWPDLAPQARLPFLVAQAPLEALQVEPGRDLAREARQRFGTLPWSADEWTARMVSLPLPPWLHDLRPVRAHFRKRGLDLDVHFWRRLPMVRCAFDHTNQPRDLDQLERAWREVTGAGSKMLQWFRRSVPRPAGWRGALRDRGAPLRG